MLQERKEITDKDLAVDTVVYHEKHGVVSHQPDFNKKSFDVEPDKYFRMFTSWRFEVGTLRTDKLWDVTAKERNEYWKEFNRMGK